MTTEELAKRPAIVETAVPAGHGWTDYWSPRRALVLASALAVLVVYLAGVACKWWPTPDSALYLAFGRSLAEGQGLVFNGDPRVLVSPGLPVLLAGLMRIFGVNFYAINLFMTLVGLAAVWLIYLIISQLSNHRTGLGVALVTAFSYRFYQSAHEILSDMPFVLAFWAMLYCVFRFQRGRWPWLALAGLFAIAGVMIRVPCLLVIGPFAVGLAVDRSAHTRKGRRLLSAGVLLAAAAAAGLAYCLLSWSAAPGLPTYTPEVQSTSTGFPYHLRQLGVGVHNIMLVLAEAISGQGLVYSLGSAALVLMVIGSVRAWRRGDRIMPLTMVLYPLALIVVTGPWAIHLRYWLPVQAFSVYLIIDGLMWVIERIARWRSRPAGPNFLSKAMTVFVLLAIGSNSPRVFRSAFYYSYLSYAGAYYEKIRRGAHKELHPVAEAIKTDSGPHDIIGVGPDKLSMLHFLSRRRMVPLPGLEQGDEQETAKITRLVRERDEPKLIVLHLRGEDPAHLRELEGQLAELTRQGYLTVVFDREHYRVYRKTTPARQLRS